MPQTKYRCTCVICGTRFVTDAPYDVCGIDCETARIRRGGDKARYVPSRDNEIVKPERI